MGATIRQAILRELSYGLPMTERDLRLVLQERSGLGWIARNIILPWKFSEILHILVREGRVKRIRINARKGIQYVMVFGRTTLTHRKPTV